MQSGLTKQLYQLNTVLIERELVYFCKNFVRRNIYKKIRILFSNIFNSPFIELSYNIWFSKIKEFVLINQGWFISTPWPQCSRVFNVLGSDFQGTCLKVQIHRIHSILSGDMCEMYLNVIDPIPVSFLFLFLYAAIDLEIWLVTLSWWN